jgi:hypothetical protein
MRIGMMRRESAGVYQCGIYAIEREGRRRWSVRAVGPGTLGDGFIGEYPTLAAAYEQCTGEPLRWKK